MRNVVFVTLAAALVAGLAYAQAPNKMAIEKAIVANEMAVNDAVAKRDLAAFNKHVAQDGWSVDPNGPMSVTDFGKHLNNVMIEPGWKIDNSKVLWVNDNVAVHVYRWTGKGTFMGQPLHSPSYASTVWANRGGNWIAVFHQETDAAPPMK